MSLPIYSLKSSEKFDYFDFRADVLEYFKEKPCPLCGKIHPPEFHMFVKRTYIEDGVTIYIMVVRQKKKKIKKAIYHHHSTVILDSLFPYPSG